MKAKQKKPIQIIGTVLVCVAILIYALYLVKNEFFDESKLYPIKYEVFVDKYSADFGVPKETVYAVIHTESSFRADAVSSAGAIGLMQIIPETFTWLSKKLNEQVTENMYSDPETNIKYGVFYLSWLYERFDNDEAVFAAYNAGYSRVKGWLADERYSQDGSTLSKIPYPETENYVKKVIKAKEKYKNIYFSQSNVEQSINSTKNCNNLYIDLMSAKGVIYLKPSFDL